MFGICRRKAVPEDRLETRLSRCLTTLDVTILAIGHMIGGGIYALTGQIAKEVAGPAVVVSYLIAGVASFLSAICYAEFGTRLPKAGSAYSYVYMSVGELAAFCVGWNIILEQILGLAAVARAWSGYVNHISGGYIHNKTQEAMPINPEGFSFISEFPDFAAFGIILFVGIISAGGAKISVRANNVLTVINIFVMLFIIFVTSIKVDFKNWINKGKGGFAPFGVAGIIAGASKCFFAYLGFDTVATAAEEMVNPSKSIPAATFGSMLTSTLFYVLMSVSLTLAVPFDEIHVKSGFASMWEGTEYEWVKYPVAIGAGCAMTTAAAGHMFALPRCVYAMAEDRILFPQLAVVSKLTQVPSLTIMGLTLFAGLLATFIRLQTLIDLLAIGTLLAYGAVSIAILLIRYDEPTAIEFDLKSPFKSLKSLPRKCIAGLLLIGIATTTVLLNFISIQFFAGDESWPWFCAGAVSCVVLLVFLFVLFTRIHANEGDSSYKIPFGPLLPLTSVVVNIVLLLSLPAVAWLRLGIWMILGLILYFSYSFWHSNERVKQIKEIE